MKIIVLDNDQLRVWFRNRPVLVDSTTGEAVLVDGKPKNPTRDEVLEMLRTIRRKKLFDVEFQGKKCHYVSGRDFLKRVFIRVYGKPVQLRNRTGHVLGTARPKFIGHDLAKSDVKPIDARSYRQAKLPDVENPDIGPSLPKILPKPLDCPVCGSYSKPLGCRDDEHHFVCRYHDAWEEYRRLELAKIPVLSTISPVVNPEHTDADALMVISLEDGSQLRPATPEEISQVKAKMADDELPIIEVDGTAYGVVTPTLALPET